MPSILAEPEFRHMLSWEVQRATRYQDFLALCLVRIESPADTRAEVRTAVAKRIADLLRAEDFVGVVDTDISVILVHSPEAEATAIGERISDRTEATSFQALSTSGSLHVKLRIAVAAFPTDATTDAALLASAQTRLRAPVASRPGAPPA